MAASPRIAVFYGTDSQMSLAEVGRWASVFQKKYGQTTRYIFAAEELGAEKLLKELDQTFAGQTLFAEPKLIIVKRLCSLDPKKGKGVAPIIAWLQAHLAQFDETVTMVFWEDRDLPADHAFLTAAKELEQSGLARLKRYQVPEAREVVSYVKRYVEAADLSIEPEALRWLQDQYRFLDRQVRLQRRLRATDQRQEDERGWWLANLLEGALVRAEDGVVRVTDLEAGHQALAQPVGVFEISEALGKFAWVEASRLLERFIAQNPDDSEYFGLYAALGWQVQRGQTRLSTEQRAYVMKLLAEIEVLSKTTTLEHAWLLELFLVRVYDQVKTGSWQSLLDWRKAWLAGLSRS